MAKNIVSRGMCLPAIGLGLENVSKLAGTCDANWQLPRQLLTPYSNTLLNTTRSIRQPDWQHSAADILGTAEKNADKVNAWCASNDSALRLDHWPNEKGAVGIAGIFDLSVRWLCPCAKRTITVPSTGIEYPAFTANQRNGFMSVYEDTRYDHTIVTMRMAGGGDNAFFCRCDQELSDGDVPYVIDNIRSSMTLRNEHPFTCVTIPMVDLKLRPDITWTHGLELQSGSRTWKIVQAEQELRLRINHTGTVPKSKTRAGVLQPADLDAALKIDGSFLCWFERPGADEPYATFLCDTDCFRDPGEFWP